jgi:hypothetical protein
MTTSSAHDAGQRPHVQRRIDAGCLDGLLGPVVPDAAFGTYVVASSDPAAGLGRHLEREVFADVFDNSVELLAEEYDPYESASLFILVVDHRRRVPAGVMRIIVPSPAGLKSLDDVARLWERRPEELLHGTGLDPATGLVWDLATLAVGRDYRGSAAKGLVSLALWQAVGVLAQRCAVDLLVAIIDLPVYRLLQLKLHGAFAAFDGLDPRPYLDSPASVAVWCRFGPWRDRIAECDPAMYALMIEGTGLEAAITPPDWDRAATTARRVSLALG